jgi:hypothetical protein
MNFKKWVKSIQTAAYNGARTVMEASNFIVDTLKSGVDVGQGINVGPGKFDKNNKCRPLNKRRA